MPDRHWFKTEDETLFFQFLMMFKGVASLSFRTALGSNSSHSILYQKDVLENPLWGVWVWIQALHGSCSTSICTPLKSCVPKLVVSPCWVVGCVFQLLHMPGGCAGTLWQLLTPGAFPEIPGIWRGSRCKHQFYGLFCTQCFSNCCAVPT